MSTVDFSLLHQVATEVMQKCRSVWPWLDVTVARDTQLSRLNWREMLNRIAAGEDNNGIFHQPYVCVELGTATQAERGAITAVAFEVPLMIGLMTALKPVSTTCPAGAGSGTTFVVGDATNIMPGIELLVGAEIVEVASVSGTTVTTVGTHGVIAAGATVKSFDVEGEISEALEKMRDALFQDAFTNFQVLKLPSVDTSSMCEVNQVLMKTNYKAQGGILKATLHVSQVW